VGTPVAFYSDRFSVFRHNQSGAVRKEGVTQFQRALETCGVNLIYANSPQAKDRVERANKTCQDRLVKELRLRNICTCAEANAYLPEFIRAYNSKFAILPASREEDHVAIQSDLDLDFIFSIHDARTITKDLLIHYRGNKYRVLTKRQPVYLAKREVLVTVDSSGLVLAWLDGNPLKLVMIDKYSKPASAVTNKSNVLVPVPPAVDLPWRTYGKKLNDNPRATIH